MHMVEATQTDRNRSVCQFKKADLEPTWNRPGTHSQWLKLTLGTGPKEIILFRGVSFLTLKRRLNFHGKQLKKKKKPEIFQMFKLLQKPPVCNQSWLPEKAFSHEQKDFDSYALSRWKSVDTNNSTTVLFVSWFLFAVNIKSIKPMTCTRCRLDVQYAWKSIFM